MGGRADRRSPGSRTASPIQLLLVREYCPSRDCGSLEMTPIRGGMFKCAVCGAKCRSGNPVELPRGLMWGDLGPADAGTGLAYEPASRTRAVPPAAGRRPSSKEDAKPRTTGAGRGDLTRSGTADRGHGGNVDARNGRDRAAREEVRGAERRYEKLQRRRAEDEKRQRRERDRQEGDGADRRLSAWGVGLEDDSGRVEHGHRKGLRERRMESTVRQSLRAPCIADGCRAQGEPIGDTDWFGCATCGAFWEAGWDLYPQPARGDRASKKER